MDEKLDDMVLLVGEVLWVVLVRHLFQCIE